MTAPDAGSFPSTAAFISADVHQKTVAALEQQIQEATQPKGPSLPDTEQAAQHIANTWGGDWRDHLIYLLRLREPNPKP